MSDYLLSGLNITDYQSCKRLFYFNKDWRLRKWRPLRLFNACLRQGILNLSEARGAPQAIANAQSRFMETAADPGLEVTQGTNTYTASKDWCALLGTILTAIGKMTLVRMDEEQPRTIGSGISWQPTAWRDDSGQLHRWITLDEWDEDAKYRQFHIWENIGDICVYEAPLMLHVIEIGRSGKRRASPWARIYKHPTMPTLKPHFRSGNGSPLKGWDPVYLADNPHPDYEQWVNQMLAEGELDRLLHHITINVPSKAIVIETKRQIVNLARAMRELEDLHHDHSHLDMSRGVCDQYMPCPYQPVCYSEKLVRLESLGLYSPRVNTKVPVEVEAIR